MARSSRQRARSARAPSAAAPVADELQSPLLALAIITGIGALLRLWYLRQPIRYDEAVTYLNFARLPWLEVIADYSYPNNHVFHTLLVKLAVGVFGNEPWVLRLPAFTAGTLTIPAAYLAARELYGQRIGLVTAALVAGCGALTLYATNARGYALVVLATLVLVFVAERARRTPAAWPWVAYALVGAVGLWTIPIMLYPLGGVTLWYVLTLWRDRAANSAVSRHRLMMRVSLATTGACVLSALLYAPVISRSGVGVLIGNTFVTPSSFADFFAALPKGISETTRLFLLGVWWPFAVALSVCIMAGVAYQRRFSRISVLLLVGMGVWCAALLLANHRVPFARVWLFVLPVLLMIGAAGAVALFTPNLARSARAPLVASVSAVLIAIALATATVASGAVGASRDTGTFFDAEAVARMLATELREGDRIVAGTVTYMPLSYWMNKLGVDSTFMTITAERARRLLLVVNMGEGETESDQLLRRRFVNNPVLSTPAVVAEFPHAKVIALLRQ